MTGDKELLAIAGRATVTISLEHLRDVDPRTRTACGYRLDVTAWESEQLGLGHTGPYDPANTLLVTHDLENDLRVTDD